MTFEEGKRRLNGFMLCQASIIHNNGHFHPFCHDSRASKGVNTTLL